jgi:peroxiredoxin
MHVRSVRLRRWSIPIVVLCLAAAGAAHAAPQQQAGFSGRPTFDITLPAYTDGQISELLQTLDDLLAPAPGTAPAPDDARMTLWQFARQLQMGRLTTAQQTRVLRHLDDVARAYPADAGLVRQSAFMVRALTIGKTAPDITGVDLEGRPLRLSDYRGKVVALVFSGDWCGICRSEYPYERLLLELYQNWPFAIVGVDSGTDLTAARTAKAVQKLTYRSFWDPPAPGRSRGPIASAWNVVGWPTVYLIDARGVIRFVDLREEDLLKGVRQLLTEQMDQRAPSGLTREHQPRTGR